MHVTNLGGHSGCKILLYETDEDRAFVRKISKNLPYNERLKRQAELQQQFDGREIKTPEILDDGFTDAGLYYFDMAYVQGITLAEYIKTIEIGKVRGLVDKLVRHMVPRTGGQAPADEALFTEKIQSLRNRLEPLHDPSVDMALARLEGHSWAKFTRSPCHGDMTLENILVKDNQLYLIDFLDSFCSCWLFDAGALMQDIQTLWAYRHQPMNINTLIRLITFRDIFVENIRETVGDDCLEVYYALLLKLIRIYPYAKDQETLLFLDEKVRSVMEIIQNKEGAVTCGH